MQFEPKSASSITLEILTQEQSYYTTVVPKSEDELKKQVENLCKKGFWTDNYAVIRFVPPHSIRYVEVHINEA